MPGNAFPGIALGLCVLCLDVCVHQIILLCFLFMLLTFSIFSFFLPLSFSLLLLSLTVGGLWNTGRGGMAVSDPGQLCHTLLIPPIPLSSQSTHCGRDHHHGDWLPRLCRSCQRKSSAVAEREYLPLLMTKIPLIISI